MSDFSYRIGLDIGLMIIEQRVAIERLKVVYLLS